LLLLWLQRTSDITYCFFQSPEVRYNEVLLYCHWLHDEMALNSLTSGTASGS